MQMRRETFARIEKSYDQTVMDWFVIQRWPKTKTKIPRRQLGFV